MLKKRKKPLEKRDISDLPPLSLEELIKLSEENNKIDIAKPILKINKSQKK